MRYEIFHDVLAQAILNWRRRYVAEQQEEKIRREEQALREAEQKEEEQRRGLEQSRRMRKAIIALSIVLVLMGGVLTFAIIQTRRARKLNAQLTEKLKKDQSASLILKGNAALGRKRLDDAVKAYEEARSLDPKNPATYSNKGYAQMRLGDKTKQYDEAIKTLEDLTSNVDPSYALGHYNLALAYWKNGKSKEAYQEVAKVLDLGLEFCKTFKDDANYNKWVLSTDEYRTACKGQDTAQ